MNWQFEKVAGPYQSPTVGVAWDGEAVLFTVPNGGYVYRLNPATNATSEYRRYMRRIAGIGFAPDGDFFACQEGSRRIVQFQKDGSTHTTASFFDGVIHNHPNDLCVDKLGRVWFSDAYNPVPPIGIYRPPLPHASVLRLERDNNRAWRIVRITQDTGAPRAVLLAYLCVFMPLAYSSMSGVIVQIHPSLEEASRVAGAGWARTIARIVVPLLRPGILATWALLFMVSVREVSASIFLASSSIPVLGPAILNFWDSGGLPKVSALTLVQACLIMACMIIVRRLTQVRTAIAI